MSEVGLIETPTGALAYRVDGPSGAPPLVLSSSLGTTAALWDRQMPALAPRFRVVRYDHPGHGRSSPLQGPATVEALGRQVLSLLDALGVDRASFCGLSLGGMVGMWLAAEASERVDRLVLACTAPHLGPADTWLERAAAVRVTGTEALVEGLLTRWFTPGFCLARPEVGRAVGDMLCVVDPDGYGRCCEAIAAADLRGCLSEIRAPTLVVGGADDPVVPLGQSAAIAEAIPGASLVALGGAAHLANLEQPERFNSVVLDHLWGTPAARGTAARRAVLGDDHVDQKAAHLTPFGAPFEDLITRYAWGEIWARPGVDLRVRSCITLAMLVALGRQEELAMHVRGAVRNGVSEDEIVEVLLQTAIYCGVPAANAAFSVAQQVLESGTSG